MGCCASPSRVINSGMTPSGGTDNWPRRTVKFRPISIDNIRLIDDRKRKNRERKYPIRIDGLYSVDVAQRSLNLNSVRVCDPCSVFEKYNGEFTP